jgi:Ca2+-binding EF-hand superfamily protein
MRKEKPMNARNRNLLALALGAALASPLATAQVGVKIGGGARAQVGVTAPPVQLPQRAIQNTTRAVERTAERGRASTRRAIDRATEAATTEAEVGIDARANVNANPNANANAAAHSEAGMRQAWAVLDADGDGRISLAEAAADAAWAESFGRLDADGDGFISESEYRAQAHADHVVDATVQGAANAAGHSMVAARSVMAALDADGDGRISAGEAAADADFNLRFADLDDNDDGYVSLDEYRLGVRADGQTAVGAAATGAANAAAHSAVAMRSLWAELDADGDGRISLPEAAANAGFQGGFSAMDADGDGFVTEAEYRAHAQAQRKP